MAESESVQRAHQSLIAAASTQSCSKSDLTPSNVSVHTLPQTASFSNIDALATAARAAVVRWHRRARPGVLGPPGREAEGACGKRGEGRRGAGGGGGGGGGGQPAREAPAVQRGRRRQARGERARAHRQVGAQPAERGARRGAARADEARRGTCAAPAARSSCSRPPSCAKKLGVVGQPARAWSWPPGSTRASSSASSCPQGLPRRVLGATGCSPPCPRSTASASWSCRCRRRPRRARSSATRQCLLVTSVPTK